MLAGSIEGLHYPPLCPNCGAIATDPLPITKAFMYNHHDDSGWRYRMAQATPLFCRACIGRHEADALPVTAIDRLKSLFFTELALPPFAMATLGLFLLNQTGFRDWHQQWPIFAMIGLLFLFVLLGLRSAWRENAYRRLPMQTQTSRSFDFGDNATSLFQTTSRTYAIRDKAYAEAFEQLNVERSAALLGPAQRRRENRAFWIAAAIIAAVALVANNINIR